MPLNLQHDQHNPLEPEIANHKASANDGAGNSFQLALAEKKLPLGTNILTGGPCNSSSNGYYLAGVFDLDTTAPDLTFIAFPKSKIAMAPQDIKSVVIV